MRWDPHSLVTACQGRLLRAGEQSIESAFIDSRNARPGALFVPIVAARDGHDFIESAIRNGAVANLQQAGHAVPSGSGTVVEVDDTLKALTELGRSVRKEISGPVVAVTGSNGKTTTRSMVAAVVATRHASTLTTKGNFNNHLGVPLSLLDEPHQPDAAVLELGMSALGEVDHLAGLVSPTVAVVTSVELEHLETMGDLDTIAQAETESFAHLPKEGVIVVPSDDPRLMKRASEGEAESIRKVTFGPGSNSDISIAGCKVGERTSVLLKIGKQSVHMRLKLFGAHNARNAAAAVAVGHALEIPVEQMVEALEAVEPVGDRSKVIPYGSHTLIADCYNANPGSMEAAIRSLAAWPKTNEKDSGPRVAVLGDMLELGPQSPKLHEKMGELCLELGLDSIICVGEMTTHLNRVAGNKAYFFGVDYYAAEGWLREILRKSVGGVVLFKGSRGMKLERFIESMIREPG